MGHRQLTNMEGVLLLLPLITRNLIGLKPPLPLSPSGWMPFVTSWPLWLYCGRDERRLSRRSSPGTVRGVFSLMTSRSREDRWPLYEDLPLFGYSREDLERCGMAAGREG